MIATPVPRRTHRERIETHLATRSDLCDDCLAYELKISRRQKVYAVCAKSATIHRADGKCIGCQKNKIVRSLSTSSGLAISSDPHTVKSKARKTNYLREEDLQAKFNSSISRTLRIEANDYYSQLGFEELLLLKVGYARIHDIITLKLTWALVDWVGSHLDLSREAKRSLRDAINAIHPNASGFDLDSKDLNVIGEVKGCIPMNNSQAFGASQTRGLTNDVLQMLGRPAQGKDERKLSKTAKIRREHRGGALKFLGLYDSPNVRAATDRWKLNLLKSKSWTLGQTAIRDLPKSGDLSSDAVYIVYLTPNQLAAAVQ